MIRKNRNYLFAAVFTVMGTVYASMSSPDNFYWYIQSDLNVFMALFIAWLFDDLREE